MVLRNVCKEYSLLVFATQHAVPLLSRLHKLFVFSYLMRFPSESIFLSGAFIAILKCIRKCLAKRRRRTCFFLRFFGHEIYANCKLPWIDCVAEQNEQEMYSPSRVFGCTLYVCLIWFVNANRLFAVHIPYARMLRFDACKIQSVLRRLRSCFFFGWQIVVDSRREMIC